MTTEDAPTPTPEIGFRDLGLPESFLAMLATVGYETPSPIQRATIPHLLGGRDLIGQAQTGTGKTAAFALPILARLDLSVGKPQALVLTPTRELAIQVAEAFHSYATPLRGFHVLPIYGGQSYVPQLAALQRGVHVVVGTPGRVIDHLERRTLDLSALAVLVLDEADEMLRMGFQDEVEKILSSTPATRQTALFSATMPPPIRKIAQSHLKDPVEVTIAGKTRTAEMVHQRFCLVSPWAKLDALTRILGAEPFDAMLVFTRTKQGTDELAEKLEARGFAVAAIHGDMAQAARERTIGQLRDAKIDILVATDVAARGLDVDRISHVLNYDVPYDTESYVHRIGRTGRAGRSGEAILFVSPRERGMLRTIERATRQPIEPMELPSIEDLNILRVAKFRQKITDTLSAGGLDSFRQLVEEYEREHDVPALEVAAALAKIARGDEPLRLEAPKPIPPPTPAPRPAKPFAPAPRDFGDAAPPSAPRPQRGRVARPAPPGFTLYRIEVGRDHGVAPGNIVGAITNEAGLPIRAIGRIDLFDDYSVVELPEDLERSQLLHLKGVWVSGRRLRITRADEPPDNAPEAARPGPPKSKSRPPLRMAERRPGFGPSRGPRKPPAGGGKKPWDKGPKRAK